MKALVDEIDLDDEALIGVPSGISDDIQIATEEGLTVKQARFVFHVCAGKTPNASAKAAAYQSNDASRVLMQNPKVVAAIRDQLGLYNDKIQSDLRAVLAEYNKIAFFDPRALVDANGNPIPLHELDDISAAAVSGLDIATDNVGGNITTQVMKYRIIDKSKALESLAKVYGAFTERLQLTGAGGGPIEHRITMTPEEAYKAMLDG